jgi:hypothetical protein
MIGCMPFLAMVGVVLSRLTTTMTSKISAAYSEANAIAQQSISQVRTVAAYNQEAAAAREYEEALRVPLEVRWRGGRGRAGWARPPPGWTGALLLGAGEAAQQQTAPRHVGPAAARGSSAAGHERPAPARRWA